MSVKETYPAAPSGSTTVASPVFGLNRRSCDAPAFQTSIATMPPTGVKPWMKTPRSVGTISVQFDGCASGAVMMRRSGAFWLVLM